MPCRDSYDSPNFTISKSSDYNELQRRLDLATRVACNAMTVITEDFSWLIDDGEIQYVIDNKLTKESKDWFKNHQETDQRRREALKASAKAKLTPEEREVLGL